MDRKKVLEGILAVAAVLMAYYAYKVIRYDVHHDWVAYLAAGLLAISVLSKWLSAKIMWMWFKLGEAMGYVMSRVILSIVFFVFLFPISLLARVFTKDLLKLKKNGISTYHKRNHTYQASDLDNPW